MTLATSIRVASAAAGLVGVTVVFLVVTAPEANANDVKIVAGAGCVATSGANQDLLSYPLGAVQNNDNNSQSVTCPIIRDNSQTSYGLWDLDAYVSDPGSEVRVICTASIRSIVDLSTLCTQTESTSIQGSGSHLHLDWGTQDLYDSACDETGAYFFMTCELPKAGGVLNLISEEI